MIIVILFALSENETNCKEGQRSAETLNGGKIIVASSVRPDGFVYYHIIRITHCDVNTTASYSTCHVYCSPSIPCFVIQLPRTGSGHYFTSSTYLVGYYIPLFLRIKCHFRLDKSQNTTLFQLDKSQKTTLFQLDKSQKTTLFQLDKSQKTTLFRLDKSQHTTIKS